MVECAAICHDFGHPPFGHKGEEVLQGILERVIQDKIAKALGDGRQHSLKRHRRSERIYSVNMNILKVTPITFG